MLGQILVRCICFFVSIYCNYLMWLRVLRHPPTAKASIKVLLLQPLQWLYPDLLDGNALLAFQRSMHSPLHLRSQGVFLDWSLIDLLLSPSDGNECVYPPGSYTHHSPTCRSLQWDFLRCSNSLTEWEEAKSFICNAHLHILAPISSLEKNIFKNNICNYKLDRNVF